MTREETIKKMMEKANLLKRNGWTREGSNDIWEMASDWNRTHDDSEIFMCEIVEEDGLGGYGFYIEEDYWVFDC